MRSIVEQRFRHRSDHRGSTRDRHCRGSRRVPWLSAGRDSRHMRAGWRMVQISGTAPDYPALVTNALNRLRDAGVDGPFAIALSERCYVGAYRGDRGRLSRAAACAAPDRWATGVGTGSRWRCGGLAPRRRFRAYRRTGLFHRLPRHNAERVQLYIEESFTFWLQSPQAAVPLVFPAGDALRSPAFVRWHHVERAVRRDDDLIERASIVG